MGLFVTVAHVIDRCARTRDAGESRRARLLDEELDEELWAARAAAATLRHQYKSWARTKLLAASLVETCVCAMCLRRALSCLLRLLSLALCVM